MGANTYRQLPAALALLNVVPGGAAGDIESLGDLVDGHVLFRVELPDLGLRLWGRAVFAGRDAGVESSTLLFCDAARLRRCASSGWP